nr:helicase-related protein [Microbulbifer sp. GX H0434]
MAGISDEERRKQAVELAYAFWKLFNRPTTIKLLGQLANAKDHVYWREVLRYCIQGNLQAVLDETWHQVWEQRAWSTSEAPAAISLSCIRDIAHSVEPRPSRVHSRLYQFNRKGRLEDKVQRLRTGLALRFGNLASEEGAGALSQDAVRTAFNSPFRPFVLATTSVGQEGLDFHPWCHQLVHWNLPSNPVDLEQREGRVHRYKGHAVRKNVAERFGEAAMQQWKLGEDLWQCTFELADIESRANNEPDLVPYWIATGRHKVERKVPNLPYSREVESFRRLKRQLASYRVVFGQPRQEELLALLDQAELNEGDIQAWAIDLSPDGNNL